MTKTDFAPTPQPDQTPGTRKSPARWITLAIANTILLILIGLIIYAGLMAQNRPPVLAVEMSRPIRIVGEQFYVPFSVTNKGGSSVEAIQIVAELMMDDGTNETGEQQLDSLSGGETIQGSFVFTHDPRRGDLLLRVASYIEPQVTEVLLP